VQTIFQRDKQGGPNPVRPPRRKQRRSFLRGFSGFTLQGGPEFRSRRLARRFAFYSLLAAAAAFGVMLGLLLVYSVDLPQIDDLMRYRPATTTDLYDVHRRQDV
jgi:hypothetical protein